MRAYFLNLSANFG